MKQIKREGDKQDKRFRNKFLSHRRVFRSYTVNAKGLEILNFLFFIPVFGVNL
jgi:hypothetical protein